MITVWTVGERVRVRGGRGVNDTDPTVYITASSGGEAWQHALHCTDVVDHQTHNCTELPVSKKSHFFF